MYEAWVDGSVRNGNPGLGGIGIYVEHNGSSHYRFSSIIGGDVTTNQAEYVAVATVLKYLCMINTAKEDCKIHTDSALVHGHVIKGWKCNFSYLRVLRDEVRKLIQLAPFKIELIWTNRLINEIANELAQAVTAEEKERRG